MVSGLVTSPCDQLRIFSGEARLMRMESKSLIALPRSNGLERYKVSSCRVIAFASRLSAPDLLLISLHLSRSGAARDRCFKLLRLPVSTGNGKPETAC